MFHRLSKHLEFRQNTSLRAVFSTLFFVFGYPDEAQSPVFDISDEDYSAYAVFRRQYRCFETNITKENNNPKGYDEPKSI